MPPTRSQLSSECAAYADMAVTESCPMPRSAPRTHEREHPADRAPRHSVQRLKRPTHFLRPAARALRQSAHERCTAGEEICVACLSIRAILLVSAT